MKRTYLLLILCVVFCGLKAQSGINTLRLSTYLSQVEDNSRCRGMMCMPYREHIYYGHTGDTFGIHSLGVYNEKEDVSIAVNVNGATFPFNEFLLGIFKSLYGE